MIKSIMGFIDGTITEIKRTSQSIYLSDNTHWNLHRFHSNRVLVTSLLNREVDIFNSVYDKKINNIRVQKELIIATQKNENKKDILKQEFLELPIAANRRFVCGYCKDKKFMMVFYNYSDKFDNGHSNIAHYYRDNIDKSFYAVSGGFFLSNGHNNTSDRTKYHLFGRSDTYGSFELQKEEIIKYGIDNKLIFTFGQTEFETGEKSDILSVFDK